jgi:hypothetical protein
MSMAGQIKKYFVLTALIILPLLCKAGSFEGSIMLVQESCYDTAFYTYYVSDGKIRIEKRNSKRNLQNVYIINTLTEEVFIVDPSKKLYAKLKKKSPENGSETQYTILKTNNFKMINGTKCYQWRVKSRERNTEISYWVTQNNFDFFEKMVKILNQTELSWEYFCQIPQSQGFFPMLSVERNLVRDEKNRTSVLQIERRAIDSAMFRIPSDYKLFAI